MQQSYTAVVKQDEGWWIGWIEEVPGVNCQETTREDLLETLRVTLPGGISPSCSPSVRASAASRRARREGTMLRLRVSGLAPRDSARGPRISDLETLYL